MGPRSRWSSPYRSQREIPSRADAVSRRFPLTILMILVAAVSASAQALSDADLKRHFDSLSDFTYANRMTAARMIRRVPAAAVVPALEASARSHPDEFVRYRALVILTSVNDNATAARMRS